MEDKSVIAVLDANVFFDLHCDKQSPRTEKEIIAHSLLADWLLDDVVLCLTPEINNEIHRRENKHERLRNLSFAEQFPKVQCEKNIEHQKVEQNLQSRFFLEKMTPSDESDLRHLVHAITGQANFFITTDGRLVDEIGDVIFDEFGLSIVRPSDFIVQFDELIREAEYQPARLAGTSIQISRFSPGQEDRLALNFQVTVHEKRNQFLSKLRKFLSDPHKYQVLVIAEAHGEPLALVVYSTKTKHQLEVPLFRVKKHPLAKTIAVHLVLQAISAAAKESREMIRITDTTLESVIIDALKANYFTLIDNCWVKISLQTTLTVMDTISYLSSMATRFPGESGFIVELQHSLESAYAGDNIDQLFDFEKILWPLKLLDANIPMFVVPIQPLWAMHLFDEALGRQTLFGAKPELVFNRENVYYRSAHQRILRPPARILWYITDGEGYQGVKAMRACSH